jgi:hypothetical protein
LALAAGAQNAPPIAKDTIQVRTEKTQAGKEVEGWYPAVKFEILGPLPSGSILWAEFSHAGKKWTADCETDSNTLNQWLAANCVPASGSASRFVGMADFALHLRNELQSTQAVLFRGKFKVEKTPRYETEYHVNEDWRLPIGYVYDKNDGRGIALTTWYRGKPGELKMYLFHQGKEIAKNEVCGIPIFDPAYTIWWQDSCEFVGVYPDAKSAKEGYEPNFDLSANPGEYEIKVIVAGKLGRTVKFTVTPEGKVDDSVSVNNKLGRDRAIVAVSINDPRVPYDKAAWKTGAYYGNPLTGFTGPASGPVAAASK